MGRRDEGVCGEPYEPWAAALGSANPGAAAHGYQAETGDILNWLILPRG